MHIAEGKEGEGEGEKKDEKKEEEEKKDKKEKDKTITTKDISGVEGGYESIIEINREGLEAIERGKDFDPELPLNILEWLLLMNYK